MFVAALAHQIANAFVHRDARGRHAGGHGSNNRVEARGEHAIAGAQNAHNLVHVKLVRREHGRAPDFVGHTLTSIAIEHFHRDHHGKHGARFAIALHTPCHGGEIFFISGIDCFTSAMKINRAVVAFLVRAGNGVREPFCERTLSPATRTD